MAQNMEACLIAITQLLQQNAIYQRTTLRQKVEKDLKYLHPFEGNTKKLPYFIQTIDRILGDYPEQQDLVYRVVFDLKISGSAKNFLSLTPPENWEECKTKLKQHFRSTKDQMSITNDITHLKIGSISELNKKARDIIDNITEFSVLSENGDAMKEIFTGMLIQRIKQLAAGTFACTIRNIVSWPQMSACIYNFIGLDAGNLNPMLISKNINRQSGNFNPRPVYNNNNIRQNANFRHNNGNNSQANNSGRYSSRSQNSTAQNNYRAPNFSRQNNRQSNSQQVNGRPVYEQGQYYRQGSQQLNNRPQNTPNRLNTSQQTRRSNGPQPMDVDAASQGQAANTNDEFFTN